MTDLRDARRHAYENERPEVQAVVPADARRVLDVGCSSGALGAALKARQGCEVVGIEVDPGYASDAEQRLDRVLTLDLETARLDDLGSFDCVVCADVLEHLRDPWSVLARLAALVQPGGSIVVSLPNVRHWQVFWRVFVRGTWPQTSLGIFDRTHLQWFTPRDAWVLVDDLGFAVETLQRVARVRPEGPPDTRVGRALLFTPLRQLVTYQVVVRGRRRA